MFFGFVRFYDNKFRCIKTSLSSEQEEVLSTNQKWWRRHQRRSLLSFQMWKKSNIMVTKKSSSHHHHHLSVFMNKYNTSDSLAFFFTSVCSKLKKMYLKASSLIRFVVLVVMAVILFFVYLPLFFSCSPKTRQERKDFSMCLKAQALKTLDTKFGNIQNIDRLCVGYILRNSLILLHEWIQRKVGPNSLQRNSGKKQWKKKSKAHPK